MKRHVLFLAVLLSVAFANAQDRNNDDEVVKLDSRTSMYSSMPNEVLVKFKDGEKAVLRSSGTTVASGIRSINAILTGYEIEEVEQLLPNDDPKRTLRSAKAYNGNEVKEARLDQLYRLKVSASETKSSGQLIEELKAAPEVEFAEPNYIVTALGTPVQEPMYTLQWGIPAVKLNTLWGRSTLGGDRKIIAILDTGVDIEHPDLAANIWTNTAEAAGASNYDNDRNGFKNDTHGWDFVNNTPNVRDNNSHGTHCAGIAAAVGTNGIGITGAAPNALIMPLTVLQSNGTGDIATIIKAINYAAQNGADIISMSFGSYAYSIALEQALAKAYQTSVLVGAAGNDALPLYPGCVSPPKGGPMFPGAFTFVLGVQATAQGGGLAGFSNYDCSGPVYSEYPEEQLYNYELKAPGQGIISTVPGGSYRSLNGTSMAAPLVAGGIAALLERKEFASQEMLWATLIQSANDNVVDFNAAYGYVPQPELSIVAVEVNDTTAGDGDMRADAGELIEIYPTLKNAGGTVSDIYYKIEFAEFEDPTVATILNGDTEFGYTLGSYAKMKAGNPIQIQIGQDVVDGRNISLVLTTWYGDNEGEVSQEITLNVENGVELKGMLTQDMTLYPNVHYIVTDNLAIPAGVTLTIKPGTVLKFKDGAKMSSSGQIKAFGTPDSLITFTKTDLGQNWGGFTQNAKDSLTYCVIENMKSLGLFYFNCFMKNIIVRNNQFQSFYDIKNSSFCNYYNNLAIAGYFSQTQSGVKFCNIINNNSPQQTGFSELRSGENSANIIHSSNIFSNHGKNTNFSFFLINALPTIFIPTYPSYHGSSVESIARQGIFDFNTPGSGIFGAYDLSNMLTRPSAEAHGIVWKVVVNDYDAQDQFEMLPPLGVGKHKFEVYFNRPMNKNITPTVAMGVRPPYTQNAIGEDGSWNEAGDIYTAYFTVKAASATDGLNRIYVADAQDNENFEIPYENQRFNVIVQSAGSLSSGFSATPGMGKVDLEWEAPDGYFDDLLGYNLFRYTYNATTEAYSDTVQINSNLLMETDFIDYDVEPGKTYNYMYKVMRTDMTENDYSRSVSAVPFTAEKGDANGSLSIDVADIVTTVDHIIGGNPQPFIYDAADVNSDQYVNVLDVVGIVNLILNPESLRTSTKSQSTATAVYTIENGILYVESSENIGGVQFLLHADRNSADIRALEAINHFEKVSQWIDDNTYMLLAYSMNGKEIAAGKHAILQIGEASIENIIVADSKGANISVTNNPMSIEEVYPSASLPMLKLYPNPFTSSVRIVFNIENPNSQKVDIIFLDINGKVIEQASSIVANGTYEIEWTPKTQLATGVYFCQLRINNQIVRTEKVIKN